MLRALLLAVLCASASAFAPSPSLLPSLSRSNAKCSSFVMKAEEPLEAVDLNKRRMVVGGLFALLLPIAGTPQSASAAKSGGRVGGGSFRRAPASPPRSAPAPAAAPTVVRPSVTVIQTAPSMPFGYGGGFGGGMYGGGYGFGLSPGQFLGLSALELAENIARENRRREFLEQQMKQQQQLGRDQAQIEALQKQLAETNAKVAAMSDAQKQQQK